LLHSIHETFIRVNHPRIILHSKIDVKDIFYVDIIVGYNYKGF